MIELAVRPQHGVVAAFAGRRETQRHVVNRSFRVVVVRLMACDARGIRQLVVVVNVAQRAGRGRMLARQWETRRSVIKLAIGPQNRVVTAFAGCREIQSDVIDWRLGTVVSGLVTRNARRRSQVVIIVDMTLRALQRHMRPSQREPGGSVVKCRVRPQRGIVAALAGRRIFQRHMIHRSLGCVVVRLVAGYTRRVRELVVIVNVTLGARRSCVLAGQSPAGRCMIELAVRPQHVVVAVFACGRETQSHMIHRRLRIVVSGLVAGHARRAGQFVVVINMAQCTLQRRMRSGQREASLRVVKRCAGPVGRAVTGFAGRR